MTTVLDDRQRQAARVLGFVYLPSFVLVAAANFGVLQPLLGGVGPAQVARNIVAHETLFRVGIAGFILYGVGVLVVSVAGYVLLRPVGQTLALLATFGRMVHGLTWLLVAINMLTALRLLTRPEYAGLPPELPPVLARLYVSGFDQYYVGLLFWALGATVGAYLWLRSGLVPKILSAFGVLASAWCAGCTLILLIFPGFSEIVNLWLFDVPMVLFEMALSVLLLIHGLRPARQAAT
jgi:hypothetical protein